MRRKDLTVLALLIQQSFPLPISSQGTDFKQFSGCTFLWREKRVYLLLTNHLLCFIAVHTTCSFVPKENYSFQIDSKNTMLGSSFEDTCEKSSRIHCLVVRSCYNCLLIISHDISFYNS